MPHIFKYLVPKQITQFYHIIKCDVSLSIYKIWKTLISSLRIHTILTYSILMDSHPPTYIQILVSHFSTEKYLIVASKTYIALWCGSHYLLNRNISSEPEYTKQTFTQYRSYEYRVGVMRKI